MEKGLESDPSVFLKSVLPMPAFKHEDFSSLAVAMTASNAELCYFLPVSYMLSLPCFSLTSQCCPKWSFYFPVISFPAYSHADLPGDSNYALTSRQVSLR